MYLSPGDDMPESLQKDPGRTPILSSPSVIQLDNTTLGLYFDPGAPRTRSQLDAALAEVRSKPDAISVLISPFSDVNTDKIRYLFDFHIVRNGPVSPGDSCTVGVPDGGSCQHSFSAPGQIITTCTDSSSSTCTVGARSVKFQYISDWGALGKGLTATARSVNANVSDFIVFGGDNVYEMGISNPHDPLMTEVYLNHFRDVPVPQYVIEGNHDGYGSYLSQLLYRQYWPAWVAEYYFFHRMIKVRGTTTCLLLIDTNDIYQSGQIAFMHTVLGSHECQESDFIVVAGHHPVFSTGGHGDSSTMKLALLPILTQYRVDIYLAGHDHTFSVHRDQGVMFVVAGAASKKTTSMWYTTSSKASETLFSAINQYGYAVLDVKGSRLSTELVNAESERVIYTAQSESRRNERMGGNDSQGKIVEVTGTRSWSRISVTLMVFSILLSWVLGILAIQPRQIIHAIKPSMYTISTHH